MKRKAIQTNKENPMRTFATANSSYEVRSEMHQGRKHLIVPVIMMVEGVHHGSHGPILHLAEDLGHFPASWDGIPVSIQHPEVEGAAVSANSPEIIDTTVVGRIYHTHMEEGKLKAEAWIDEGKIRQVSPMAYSYLTSGNPLQVSVGVFTDDEPSLGEWNGEEYAAIARNHRPDHLALLPGGQGACSWTDGCGIRANENGKGGEELDELIKTMKAAVAEIISTMEIGFREIGQTLQTKLDRMDTDIRVHFLEEVFDGFFVYRVMTRERGEDQLYKRSYTVNEGSIEIGEDPVQVTRSVEYIPQTNEEDIEMKRNKGAGETPCCPEKVELLIQNEQSRFGEDDRDWLLAQSEEVLDKLEPVEIETPVAVPGEGEGVQMNEDAAIKVLKDTLSDPEKFLELLPAETRAQMEHGMKLHKAHRAQSIARIQASAPDVYTEEELEAMTSDQLEKLARVAKVPVDYSGQGSGREINANEETQEPLMMVTD